MLKFVYCRKLTSLRSTRKVLDLRHNMSVFHICCSNLTPSHIEWFDMFHKQVHERLISESYSPRTWRTHALHLCPPEPYDPFSPQTRATLDWVFFISALNFSFWSEKEGTDERYGVEWREGWGSEKRKVHTGYWSLVAAVDRGKDLDHNLTLHGDRELKDVVMNLVCTALEEGIPITDPTFYCSEMLCPDGLIEEVFAPAPQSTETAPLIRERIQVLREVGHILCEVSP